MKSIYKKELNMYFRTAIGYVYICIHTLLAGLIFAIVNLASLSSDIPSFFAQFSIVQIFLLPILCMGLFAKEQTEGTYKLLFSTPIKSSNIVFGKFFAAFTLVLITCIISTIFIIIIAIYGKVYIPETLLAYLGFLLMSIYFLALDTFIASFSKHQISSIVISFAVNLVLWFIDLISSSQSGLLYNTLSFLSPYKRLSSFMISQFSISNSLYFILFAVLFLWACTLKINTQIYGGIINENK